MPEMLGLNAIMNAPGAGTIFLVVVLLCYFAARSFLAGRKTTVKTNTQNNDTGALQAEVSPPLEAKDTAAVTAAIVAAVTEYRRHNFI